MEIKPIAFSFAVSLSIAFLFLLTTFWIFYEYSGSEISANDALSTTGSYFGAVATLGAAIIAAYLFTDWRDEKEYDLKTNYLIKCIERAKSIEMDLIALSTVISNIGNIEKFKVLKYSYIEDQVYALNNLLHYYGEIKTYSKISKKKEFMDDHLDLQKSLLVLNGLYVQLILDLYKPYFKMFNKDYEFNVYLDGEKNTHEYSKIVDFFNNGRFVEVFDNKGKVELTIENAKITDFLQKSLDKINEITEKLDCELEQYLSSNSS